MEKEKKQVHICKKCEETPHSPSRSPSSSPDTRRQSTSRGWEEEIIKANVQTKHESNLVPEKEHVCKKCVDTPHSPPQSPQQTRRTSRRRGWNVVEGSLGHVMKSLRNKNRN